ncbi:MAG TPA: DUF1761 domain-containing protein [Candidatus Limnocylindrales bacterium]|nr:DUF1761 domain-containing protein [Candidatus Limnocylindrales bacterium]
MNWVAIVIAVVVNMILGSLWFSPMLFSKKWMEWEGHTEQMGSGSSLPLLIGLTAIGGLVSAIALDWFIDRTGTNTLAGGLLIGLYAGLGFVAPAMFADHLFNNRRGALFLIVAGYPILGLAIMGAILGALR